VDPETTCEEVRQRAERKIAEAEDKIQTLARIKGALQQLVVSCSGQGPTSTYPILEALDSQEPADGARAR
jgi:hypothetical protein